MRNGYVLIVFRDGSFMLHPIDTFRKKDYATTARFFRQAGNTTLDDISTMLANNFKHPNFDENYYGEF